MNERIRDIARETEEEELAAAKRLELKRQELAEERLERERRQGEELVAEIGELTSSLQQGVARIGGALTGAFQQAIEGEQAFEDAFAQGVKGILKGIGEQMVQTGILKVLEGITNLVTNQPAAAVQIGGGTALIAAGVGLGAAGAAVNVPSSAAGRVPERPNRDTSPDRSGGELAPITVVVGTPIVTAATETAVSQQIAEGVDFAGRRRNRIRRAA